MTSDSNEREEVINLDPTKEYIKNSLLFGIGVNSNSIIKIMDNDNYRYSSPSFEVISRNRGKLTKKFLVFVYKNKDMIKKIPFIGDWTLSIKRSIMNKYLEKKNQSKKAIDLSEEINLELNKFLQSLFLILLGREIDADEIRNFSNIFQNGGSKQAIIYIVYKSKEFSKRNKVANINSYRIEYLKYLVKKIIRKLKFNDSDWNKSEPVRKNSSHEIDNIEKYQTVLKKLDKIEEMVKNIDSRIGLYDNVLENTNKLKVTLDKLANESKPIYYGFPDGVTIVQTDSFFFGIPSEEWRLAVFLSKFGYFEHGTEIYIRTILKEGLTFIDIGANLGIYTLYALKAGCSVYSYEPTPRIYKILLDNIGINGFEPSKKARVFNLAISDNEGEVDFSIFDVSGHNSFYPQTESDKKIKVKTVSLDKHLSHLSKVDIVKIDVEGAEPLVLNGMKNIIQNNPQIKIILEFAPNNLERSGIKPLDFINTINAMGLSIKIIEENSGNICTVSQDELINCYSVNVLLEKSGV